MRLGMYFFAECDLVITNAFRHFSCDARPRVGCPTLYPELLDTQGWQKQHQSPSSPNGRLQRSRKEDREPAPNLGVLGVHLGRDQLFPCLDGKVASSVTVILPSNGWADQAGMCGGFQSIKSIQCRTSLRETSPAVPRL